MFDQLLWWLKRPAALHVPQPVAPADDGERVLGCGWFDSSHDLVQGVHVVEVADDVTPLWRWAARTQA